MLLAKHEYSGYELTFEKRRYKSGCRNFTAKEAIRHWSKTKPTAGWCSADGESTCIECMEEVKRAALFKTAIEKHVRSIKRKKAAKKSSHEKLNNSLPLQDHTCTPSH